MYTEFDTEQCKATDKDYSINKMVTCLYEAGAALPCSKPRLNVKPFWNNNLNLLIKERKSPMFLSLEVSWVCCRKRARKKFMKELKKVQKEYDKKEIEELVEAAYRDKCNFWRKI